MGAAPVSDFARPVGILGDSDSHSYHDRVRLGEPGQRGGRFRATTLQWIEIWQRLRPREIDPGPWGTWGTRGRTATLRRFLRLPARAPKKEDYEYNLAWSGARCSSLNEGMSRQLDPLLQTMATDPLRWASGIVIIRIGVNDFGQPDALDRMARGVFEGAERTPIITCLDHIGRAVRKIRERYPETKIVLVGIYNNVHWAKTFERWHDPLQLRRIDEALDVFDDGLRTLAESDSNIAFHDDRAWLAARWGGRSPTDGAPAYRAYPLNGVQGLITNTIGDHPSNLVLEDNHLGTAGNALWLQSLVDLIESTWSLGLTRITPEEVLVVTDPDGAFGLRAPPAIDSTPR